MKVRVHFAKDDYLPMSQDYDADSWELTHVGGLLVLRSKLQGGPEVVAEFQPTTWSYVELLEDDEGTAEA